MTHAPMPRLPLVLAALAALAAATVAPIVAQAQAAEDREQAQAAEDREVVAVVERFFQGMLERDADVLRSTVDPTTVLASVSVRDGRTVISATPIERFITSVTTRQGEPANERIFAPRVQIDGNLANVWTFYTLHVGDRFSHCGYDSFQMLRTEDGWKIIHIADTRRTENCEPPGGDRP